MTQATYDDAHFLVERLREFERDLLDDEVGRQFNGHVSPAVARLEASLTKARGESCAE